TQQITRQGPLKGCGHCVAVLTLVLALTCSQPPVIDEITASPNPVPQNGTSVIRALAHSPHGLELTYYWHCESGGSVTDTRQDTTVFTAPKLTGVYPISLRVLDSRARSRDTLFRIEVVRIGTTQGLRRRDEDGPSASSLGPSSYALAATDAP
ncbi:MAG: hypothetical protein ABIK62_00645, partial [candidate division WOR-3 bacterium]